MRYYKAFLTQGFASMNDSNEVKLLRIVRDMGAAEIFLFLFFVFAFFFLLLESALPLSERTSTD
jgi:hypothetical protein